MIEDKYKEVLERAKQEYGDELNSANAREVLERVFPELEDSDDEKIRKGLLRMFNKALPDLFNRYGMNKNDAIAWIKKQSEQRLENQPKFKVGDWVIEEGTGTWCVVELCATWYEVIDNKDNRRSISYSREDKLRLWTIQDAKDGDILMANAPFIFNGNLEGGIGCPGAHCAINTLGKFQIPKYKTHWTGHITTPATKEQCDLLFKKMREAGYEWDEKIKELKKIETQNPIIQPKFKVGDIVQYITDSTDRRRIIEIDKCCEMYRTEENISIGFEDEDEWKVIINAEDVEQKPAWGEDDEVKLEEAICMIEANGNWVRSEDAVKDISNWLKSLRPQPKQEWSKEDEKMLNDAIGAIGAADYYTYDDKQEIENWLKSLIPQPKQEWSEEDEHKVKDICYFLETAKKHYASDVALNECIDWLKSLKEKINL